jgi:hypothetical protein
LGKFEQFCIHQLEPTTNLSIRLYLGFSHNHDRRVVTLEDVLESLIQEEIYDEYDRQERRRLEVAKWGYQRWRKFVRHQKKRRGGMPAYASIPSEPKMLQVVEDAIHQNEEDEKEATESTSLLGRLNPFK